MPVHTIYTRISNLLSWMTIVILVFFVGYYIYSEQQKTKPIKVMEILEANMITKTVKPGDWITYKFKIRRYLNSVGENDRRIIGVDNKVIIQLHQSDSFKRYVGLHEGVIYLRIPPITPPGQYQVVTTTTWPHSNGRHYEPTQYRTDTFEVVK